MIVEQDAVSDDREALRSRDVCALQSARRVAAMLDIDPASIKEGEPLPRGWHFFLLGGNTRRSQLRADGFPGFGFPMPDLGLPRLLLGGRTVSYHGDMLVGAQIERLSKILRLDHRVSDRGASVIVTLQHELRTLDRPQPQIVETQTYILLPEANGAKPAPETTASKHLLEESGKTITPDETLLFHYSALGFNSHKIHLDRDYARQVEGFPDLVVNGGLATLLATEFLRTDLGILPVQLKTKHVAPLFCGRPITFVTRRDGRKVELKALNEAGTPAMELEIELA